MNTTLVSENEHFLSMANKGASKNPVKYPGWFLEFLTKGEKDKDLEAQLKKYQNRKKTK